MCLANAHLSDANHADTAASPKDVNAVRTVVIVDVTAAYDAINQKVQTRNKSKVSTCFNNNYDVEHEAGYDCGGVEVYTPGGRRM